MNENFGEFRNGKRHRLWVPRGGFVEENRPEGENQMTWGARRKHLEAKGTRRTSAYPQTVGRTRSGFQM